MKRMRRPRRGIFKRKMARKRALAFVPDQFSTDETSFLAAARLTRVLDRGFDTEPSGQETLVETEVS